MQVYKYNQTSTDHVYRFLFKAYQFHWELELKLSLGNGMAESFLHSPLNGWTATQPPTLLPVSYSPQYWKLRFGLVLL
jgi:hypothetical protein